MKRILALLLTLLLAGPAVLAETPAETEMPAETEAPAETQAETGLPNRLTVGNPTPMRGEFFTNLWGNATSDIDVRELLHGYNLIRWDGENGLFTTDPTVVKEFSGMQNGAGDHSYILTLYDDLYYSDGTRITAWDYAFSYLFGISPQVEEIGGNPLQREQFMGWDEWFSGEKKELAGVRVLSEYTLMVTIRHEYLPFFYELGLLDCHPYPVSVIAPGVQVRDDGHGVYLANADGTTEKPVFTAELLRETVLNPETGYLSHPSVVSGPYMLTGWDGTTAEFTVNPYYKGNAAGEKPSIAELTYTVFGNDPQMRELLNGGFGLLNKVMRQDVLQEGLKRVGTGRIKMSNYPRVGLSFFSFACERKTVASRSVRQALAWCMDRDRLTSDYTVGFGTRADGFYGVGQWMYRLVTGAAAPPVEEPAENDAEGWRIYDETRAAFEALSLENLTAYTADPETAVRLLEEDGWTLNGDGLRQKEIDGETVVLDLKLIYPEGNRINESLERFFVPYLEQAGIRLTMEAVPMNELLTCWYRQGERDADMIYLASNFDVLFDPASYFMTDREGTESWAYTNAADAELYRLALAMRHTEPGDVLAYMRNWIRFQERFNETLPMIPVYSNMYFDFYTPYLRNYRISSSSSWAEAIVGAFLSEEEPEAAEDTP